MSVIRDLAAVQGDQPALLGDDEELSYAELVDRADRYASWAALRQKATGGDVIGLLMPNCPDYVAIWFGMTQAGCAVALINSNLVGDGLLHSIRVSGSSKLIVAASLLTPLLAVRAGLPPSLEIWVHGPGGVGDFPRIDLAIASHGGRPASACMQPQRQDRALLIGTSGTTGLPKAANITHARILEWSYWFAGMMDCQPEDRLYNCLPLYHSTGGIVAIGSVLSQGGSVVIRSRFSASRFWNDITVTGCTIFQYIGELCRFLTRSAGSLPEVPHRLRLCCGNGMRAEIWSEFQQRFNIPKVLEFYAATEGNVSLYNCEGKPGAIGRIPAFLAHRFPIRLIMSDAESGEPVRDDLGFCVQSAADQIGEAIGQVLPGDPSPARRFDGYTDVEASARKLLHDVFVKGDCWFRTGDLMRRDSAGYYYFVDRVGDTYRWKGENISTTEVSAVISACPGVRDSIVYGISIPLTEGRAGMAAVIVDADFDFSVLREHLALHLPVYAQPVFIRLCDRIETTGTFKPTKGPMMRRGLSLDSSTDSIWFNDHDNASFVQCDMQLLHLIQTGSRRL